MEQKTQIAVGDYVHIETWKPGDRLWSEWIEHDEEYKDNIKLLKRDEEILPAGKYTLKITYPLSVPFIQEREFDKPITREEMVKWIVECYHFIYDVENDTSLIPATNITGMLNRITTDGTYGIWGHEIGDLDLHTIYVVNNIITLGVDS